MDGIETVESIPVFVVRGCTMVLPVTGATKAWRVLRVYPGPVDGPCVAVFAHGNNGMGKTYADQFAEYLTRNKVEVL